MSKCDGSGVIYSGGRVPVEGSQRGYRVGTSCPGCPACRKPAPPAEPATCGTCGGRGELMECPAWDQVGENEYAHRDPCDLCNGTGFVKVEGTPSVRQVRPCLDCCTHPSRAHGHPCDHDAGICEDAPPDCERCSSECDECDGSGTYTIDGESRTCICAESQASPAAPIDPGDLDILRHSLGWPENYRNRFVTEPSSPDGARCVRLTAAGLMWDSGPQPTMGGMHLYHVTDAGKVAADADVYDAGRAPCDMCGTRSSVHRHGCDLYRRASPSPAPALSSTALAMQGMQAEAQAVASRYEIDLIRPTNAEIARLRSEAASLRSERDAALAECAARTEERESMRETLRDCVYRLGFVADQECECEECETCGKVANECSGTPCAATCNCTECHPCMARRVVADAAPLLALSSAPSTPQPEDAR